MEPLSRAERHRLALKAAAQISFTLPVLAGALSLGGCIEDPETEPPAPESEMGGAGGEVESGEGGMAEVDSEPIDRQWLDDGGVDDADWGLADADLPSADAEVSDMGEALRDAELADADLGCRALIDEDWEAFTECCEREGWPSPACDVWGPPMPPSDTWETIA
ncbi:MAG: hypothetical protein ACE366_31400 [Bradymonadia bacterium]